MPVQPKHGKMEMNLRKLAAIVAALCMAISASSQGYIPYHQEALKAYELISIGKYREALNKLEDVQKINKPLPTEVAAIALCQASLGDTAQARINYLHALEMGAPFGFIDTPMPRLTNRSDTIWYDRVFDECKALHYARPRYIDGPNGSVPTIFSWINRRYQHITDSLSGIYGGYGQELEGHPDAMRFFANLRKDHDATLDSIISGKLPLPTIQLYGLNSEFETFCYHVTPAHLFGARAVFKEWLEKGYIYPRL